MAKILLVLSKSPFPERSDGITIRLNPIFKYLGGRHDVDLVIACDPRKRRIYRAQEARQFCNSVTEFNYDSKITILQKIQTSIDLLSPKRAPFEAIKFWNRRLAKRVQEKLASTSYDAVILTGDLADVASMLMSLTESLPRIIIEWTDSPSLHMYRRIIDCNIFCYFFRKYRVLLMKRWERYVNHICDAAVYVTKTDAMFVNGDFCNNIHIVANGIVDCDDNHDKIITINKDKDIFLGFLGNMGYAANVAAALRLYEHIFLPLRKEFRNLKLRIIGRAPTEEILSLNSEDVIVTGEVESIWPHIYDTDIFVFPMTIGAGLQNKLLEAMHAAKPVVASTICTGGLDIDGAAAATITADTNQELCNAVRILIISPERRSLMGQAARSYVQNYDWRVLLPKYENVVLGR
ncbi:MAG: glycosyltransferase [Desulfobulbaceae bacterium]|nr:glycosyltransferase [Desulfobulbaceae bacterium]